MLRLLLPVAVYTSSITFYAYSVKIREATVQLSLTHSLTPLEKERKEGRKRKFKQMNFNLSIY